MNAEIITIGDELLLGQVVDTNSAWMGLQLADIGISVTRRTAIGDNSNDIVKALDEAKSRVEIILLTGGLGPTRDDITKKTLANYYQCGYRIDEGVEAHLEEIFAKRGRKMLEVNKMQAELPEICTTLFNEAGTAPGMLFDQNGIVIISMPGVPNEMQHIMEKRVLPWLPKRFSLPVILHKTLVTVGIPESLLADKLTMVEDSLPENIKLAYLPAYSSIRLRITAKGNDKNALQIQLDIWYNKVMEICAENLIAEGDVTPVQAIAKLLMASKTSISLAESCTGGFITQQFVLNPGISAVLNGSIISYANEIKMQELGVPAEIFTTVGAVSEACAKAMVEGCLRKFGTDVAISTTGIAGPAGATDEKPVGLVYIGVANKEKTIVKKMHFPGNREQFMLRVCNAAADLLRQVM